MPLVRSALEIGYELTSRLYRELYHHQDRSEPFDHGNPSRNQIPPRPRNECLIFR